MYQVKVFHGNVVDAIIKCVGTRKVSISGKPAVVENLEKGVVWRGKKYTTAHGLRFLEAVSLALNQNHYLSATNVEEIS